MMYLYIFSYSLHFIASVCYIFNSPTFTLLFLSRNLWTMSAAVCIITSWNFKKNIVCDESKSSFCSCIGNKLFNIHSNVAIILLSFNFLQDHLKYVVGQHCEWTAEEWCSRICFSLLHQLATVHFMHRRGHGALIHCINQENPLKSLLTAEPCINNQMWDGLGINKTPSIP